MITLDRIQTGPSETSTKADSLDKSIPLSGI